MTLWQTLWRVELRALAALLVCAGLMAGYGFIDSLRMTAPLLSPLDAASSVFAFTLLVGTLPVILCGAPVYAFLHYKGKASWLAILLVGVAPGLIAFPFISPPDGDLAGWSMLCGVAVAALTHLLSTRGRLQLAKQG